MCAAGPFLAAGLVTEVTVVIQQKAVPLSRSSGILPVDLISRLLSRCFHVAQELCSHRLGSKGTLVGRGSTAGVSLARVVRAGECTSASARLLALEQTPTWLALSSLPVVFRVDPVCCSLGK